MLSFFETYQKYKIPSSLQGEIIDANTEPLKIIGNISKVNIFIGPNNSGKSKVLRELLKEDSLPHYGDKTWDEMVKLISNFYDIVVTKLNKVISSPLHFIINNSLNGQIINTAEINEERERALTYSSNYDLDSIINNIRINSLSF